MICPGCGATMAERAVVMCRACGWKDIVRTTDPETSRIGARAITSSGKRSGHKQLIMGYVTAHPGGTRREIAAGINLTEYQVSKRISDLINDGSVVYGGAIGNQQTVWLSAQATLL